MIGVGKGGPLSFLGRGWSDAEWPRQMMFSAFCRKPQRKVGGLPTEHFLRLTHKDSFFGHSRRNESSRRVECGCDRLSMGRTLLELESWLLVLGLRGSR